ncbi:MAG: alpha-E domain-containing protein [Coprococcus sp.]|nr:alpha-E domain-containing protein [Coprococcus sp.]
MGIISIEKANNLFWLGRYSQRVYSTLRGFYNGYDEMLDRNDTAYAAYCEAMNIPDVYGSKEVFIEKYPYDTENPDSIISNLYRAYDNALVMRDYISSESLAFIQLALFDIKSSKGSDAPLITMQFIIDHLLAFWGCIDENVDDIETRNLIKLGKTVEELDIELRMKRESAAVKRCFDRMNTYMRHTDIAYNESEYYALAYEITRPDISYQKALENLMKIYDLI